MYAAKEMLSKMREECLLKLMMMKRSEVKRNGGQTNILVCKALVIRKKEGDWGTLRGGWGRGGAGALPE